MARLFLVPMLLALIPEGILAFAMVAGIVWLGNVVYGFIFVAGALLLMIFPLLGDLVIDFDSGERLLAVKMGWWGRASYRQGEPAEVRVRLLGIPYRRRLEARPPRPGRRPRAKKGKVDMKKWVLANKVDLSRALLAGLQAGNEFLWDSRAIAVIANAPSGIDVVDQIISGVVGHRIIGPVDVQAKPEGERRGRVTCRISLAAASFIGLFTALQARPVALMRSYRQAQKRAEATQAEVQTRPPLAAMPPSPPLRQLEPPEETEERPRVA